MRAPSRAVARRRRLAFTYVPAFTVGALLCTAAGPSLNGGWALGSLLMLAAIGGVLLDLERPKMTEQPAEPVFMSFAQMKAHTENLGHTALAEPVSEQEWLGNDTPQGGDNEFAEAFAAASDSLALVEDAIARGHLGTAKHHALNLVGRISRLQALSREA